jgi:hypothetical protein
MREAYRRINDDSEELKRPVEGKAVESSDFRLVPFYLSIKHGALTLSTSGQDENSRQERILKDPQKDGPLGIKSQNCK